MASTTQPKFSEDEIDDLIYFARAGEKDEFFTLKTELCKRESTNIAGLLDVAKDEYSGNGPLHMAAANGFDDLLQEICKSLSETSPQNPAMLAILNAQNKAGNTPLHWAALNGHLPAVKVLLENGGDPTITNHRGHDAIYEAELNDKTEVVKWVLEEGGDGLEAGFGKAAEGETGEEGTDADVGAEDEPMEEDNGKDLLTKIKELDIDISTTSESSKTT